MLPFCNGLVVNASCRGAFEAGCYSRCVHVPSTAVRIRHSRAYAHGDQLTLLNHVSIKKAVPGCAVSVAGYSLGPIVTDTRRQDLRGAWFIALRGSTYDGHDFIGDCLRKDVAGVIVSNQWLTSSRTSADLLCEAASKRVGVIAVPDTHTALTQLGKFAMSCYNNAVIAITGSCGKTTCKDMVGCALSFYYPFVHQAPGSYNNHIGVPLTALSIPRESHVVIFEFGTSGKGEIESLGKLINPQIRVITDIQPAHLQGFEGINGVAKEKLQLFLSAQEGDHLVFNAANAHVWEMLGSAKESINTSNVWAFAGTAATTRLFSLHEEDHGVLCPVIKGFTQAVELIHIGHTWKPLTTISLSCGLSSGSRPESGGLHEWVLDNDVGNCLLRVPALGDHLAVTAAAAVAATCACLRKQSTDHPASMQGHASVEEMLQLAKSVLTNLEHRKWLGDWSPPSGRMCVHHVTDHLVILDDSHNANPASMLSALKTLETLVVDSSGQAVRRLAVLGAMSELGSKEAMYHQELVTSASLLRRTDVFFWGHEWRCAASQSAEVWEMSTRKFMYIHGTRKQALYDAVMGWIQANSGDRKVAVVLLKGSRTAKMEDVMNFVQAHTF